MHQTVEVEVVSLSQNSQVSTLLPRVLHQMTMKMTMKMTMEMNMKIIPILNHTLMTMTFTMIIATLKVTHQADTILMETYSFDNYPR